jgi:hypothetical protein
LLLWGLRTSPPSDEGTSLLRQLGTSPLCIDGRTLTWEVRESPRCVEATSLILALTSPLVDEETSSLLLASVTFPRGNEVHLSSLLWKCCNSPLWDDERPLELGELSALLLLVERLPLGHGDEISPLRVPDGTHSAFKEYEGFPVIL